MKLGTIKDGSRDGKLAVVSSTLLCNSLGFWKTVIACKSTTQ